MKNDLYLVPGNAANWKTFLGWFSERGEPTPFISKQSVMIADDEGLVGGVCVYVSDGPWMFIEHASCRPNISPGNMKRVLDFGLQAARELGNVFTKVPLLHISNRYIAESAEKLGFVNSGSVVYVGVVGKRIEVPMVPKAGNKNQVKVCVECGRSFLGSSEVCDECGQEEQRTQEETAADESQTATKGKRSSKKKRVSTRRKKGSQNVHSSG
jgi:hypothetical protein